MYCIHQISFNIVDAESTGVQCIGLPQGQEFATAEGEFNFTGQLEESGLPIGTQLNIWTWHRESKESQASKLRFAQSKTVTSHFPPDAAEIRHQHLIKRVPLAALSAKALAALQ